MPSVQSVGEDYVLPIYTEKNQRLIIDKNSLFEKTNHQSVSIVTQKKLL